MNKWLSGSLALVVGALLSVSTAGPPPGPPWIIPVEVPSSPALRTLDRRAFISAGIIVNDFDKPAQNWLPGHRGIDLAPTIGSAVFTPAAGTIGFAGTVAGKPVVTVIHANGVRSTFEPVETELKAGALVDAADRVGTLSPGGPWHCPSACLHWGLKRGEEYLDPWRFIKPHVRIILLSSSRVSNGEGRAQALGSDMGIPLGRS